MTDATLSSNPRGELLQSLQRIADPKQAHPRWMRELASGAADEIERLTAERDEARSMADQAYSLVDSLREERAADLARAYDTGHHHCAMGITEIPVEYRLADTSSEQR